MGSGFFNFNDPPDRTPLMTGVVEIDYIFAVTVSQKERRGTTLIRYRKIVPQIGTVLSWLSAQPGAEFIRMSGSGATCFALFASEEARDRAADAVPREWWRLATTLR